MRKMIFVKSQRNESWACSDCAWVFNPLGPPLGNSLESMMRDFERQREKEFASHACAQYPKTKSPKP
jgi:hypothetical protein